MTKHRARILGAALMAVAALGTVAYAQAAVASRVPAIAATMDPSWPPVPSVPPSPEPTPTAPVPTPTAPEPTSTPSPTEPPETCAVEPVPGPTELPVAFVAAPADAGPVTCSNRHSIITVAWDGTNLTITIKPNPDFGRTLTCTLDPKSVKVTEPKGATVDKDGVVKVPYDRTKKVKLTIKIEYDINCTNGNLNVPLRDVVTIDFTPPDGPLVVTNRTR